MRLRRRTFLGMTTATVAGSLLSGPADALGSAFRPFVLILSGCDPKVDPETLFNFIDPIVSHNIPIGYAVDLNTAGNVACHPLSPLYLVVSQNRDANPSALTNSCVHSSQRPRRRSADKRTTPPTRRARQD